MANPKDTQGLNVKTDNPEKIMYGVHPVLEALRQQGGAIEEVIVARGSRARWFEDRPEALIDGATAEATLASLPDEDREIVVLRIWGGMTLQEIAETVGSPVSTVFHHYRAGLAAIRRRLESSCRVKNG